MMAYIAAIVKHDVYKIIGKEYVTFFKPTGGIKSKQSTDQAELSVIPATAECVSSNEVR